MPNRQGCMRGGKKWQVEEVKLKKLVVVVEVVGE
jgi:hypothetical protein